MFKNTLKWELSMKRIKENLSNQGILFSNHYVGDRLSEDDEVFLFEKLFTQLDISAVTDVYSSEGGSMFSPRDQLVVLGLSADKKVNGKTRSAIKDKYFFIRAPRKQDANLPAQQQDVAIKPALKDI